MTAQPELVRIARQLRAARAEGGFAAVDHLDALFRRMIRPPHRMR